MKQNRYRSLMLGLLLLLSLLLSACGASGSAAPMDMMSQSGWEPMEAPKGELSDEMGAVAGGAGYAAADSVIYQSETAKIIRRAELTLQTTEFDKALSDLAAHTEAHGGYYETARVDSGSLSYNRSGRSAYMVIRVPKERFVPFRDGLGGIGHLSSLQESTEDVGEAYYDTEARLATLTTKRERLLALLEQAELMEDIITLEGALAEVQYEIDRHTASLRTYDSLIGYSTFTVYLEEVIRVKEEPGPEESFGARLLANLTEGLHDFRDGLEELTLWLARNLIGVLLTVLLLVGVVLLRRRGWWRRFRLRKPSGESVRQKEEK